MKSSPRDLAAIGLVLTSFLSIAPLLAAPAYAEPAVHGTTLTEQIAHIDGQVARAEADVAGADAAAATAIEDYNTARIHSVAAQRRAVAAESAADVARLDLAAAREDLAAVVAEAYRSGGEDAVMFALRPAADVRTMLDRASTLDQLGARRDAAVRRIETTTALAQARSGWAGQSALDADAAAGAAATARETALTTQQVTGDRADQLLLTRDTLVAEAAALQQISVRAEAERQQELSVQRAASAAGTGPVVDVTAADSSGDPSPSTAPGAAADSADAVVIDDPSDMIPDTVDTVEAPARPSPPPTTSPTPQSPPPTAAAPTATPTSAPTTAPISQPPAAPPAPAPAPAPAPPASAPTGSGGVAGQRAVDWARTQLGKAYLWGGEGPNSYDCSGLVMRAWENAGVGLPHSSRSQYARSTKIDRAALRPGDLIFWGSNVNDPSSIYHVAVYSGGGMMIEAPNSRSVVREVPVRWSGAMPLAGRL